MEKKDQQTTIMGLWFVRYFLCARQTMLKRRKRHARVVTGCMGDAATNLK